MSRTVPGSKLIVLVVEDEALTRQCATTIVEAAGFHAIAVSSADEAIGVLEERDDIRAVFTNVQMPGSMDGIGLVRIVRERWPAVAALVTSGKTSMMEGDLPSEVPFIPKPYMAAQIDAALRELIA